MTKTQLRKIYLTKRNSLSAAEQKKKSSEICELFFRETDLTSVTYLHCFISIARFNEIDTQLIFEQVWRDHPHVITLAPRIDSEKGELESLRFTPKTELIESRWNIREPAKRDRVDAEKIDIVLVPLLCFDRRGHRVGYGKGFYDKFLANSRSDCQKIGLSYFAPTEKIDDVNERDLSIDLCVTPGKVYKFL